MTLVVDASVAVKWFLAEPDRAPALALLQSGEVLIAPDLIVGEVLNAMWKGVIRGVIPLEQAKQLAPVLRSFFAALEALDSLASHALDIAISINHPVYDCFYIALAERERAELVTADERLYRKTRETAFAATVKPLTPIA